MLCVRHSLVGEKIGNGHLTLVLKRADSSADWNSGVPAGEVEVQHGAVLCAAPSVAVMLEM